MALRKRRSSASIEMDEPSETPKTLETPEDSRISEPSETPKTSEAPEDSRISEPLETSEVPEDSRASEAAESQEVSELNKRRRKNKKFNREHDKENYLKFSPRIIDVRSLLVTPDSTSSEISFGVMPDSTSSEILNGRSLTIRVTPDSTSTEIIVGSLSEESKESGKWFRVLGNRQLLRRCSAAAASFSFGQHQCVVGVLCAVLNSERKMPPNGMDNFPGKPESAIALAERELRETNQIKGHALAHMRKWLTKNLHVSNVRTDDVFLLRFLRVTKFSLPMAEQVLLKWLNLRKTFPTMCMNLDCKEQRLKDIIDSGYVYVSPNRDSKGRRVIMYDVKRFDPSRYTAEDMARAHSLTYETLLEDSDVQIRGVVHAADLRGLSGTHVACWSPDTFIRLIRWGEQSMPMRHKEIHLLNVPTAIRYLYEMVKSLMSKKINERIVVHNNIESLCSMVDPAVLPSEYGGSMPAEEMLAAWKKEIVENNTTIKSLDTMEILSDVDIHRSKRDTNGGNNKNNIDGHFSGISGSFRKLEID